MGSTQSDPLQLSRGSVEWLALTTGVRSRRHTKDGTHRGQIESPDGMGGVSKESREQLTEKGVEGYPIIPIAKALCTNRKVAAA